MAQTSMLGLTTPPTHLRERYMALVAQDESRPV